MLKKLQGRVKVFRRLATRQNFHTATMMVNGRMICSIKGMRQLSEKRKSVVSEDDDKKVALAVLNMLF